MKPEVYFLKYSFTCASILKDWGEISQEELDELEKCALNSIAVDRDKLEKIFHNAFNFIRPLAEEMGKDKWDLEVIKEYFLKRHNEVINKGLGNYKNAPNTLKELCKVKKAKIIEKKGNILTVKYDRNQKKVLNFLVPEAKIGDIITIHYGYAVEVLD